MFEQLLASGRETPVTHPPSTTTVSALYCPDGRRYEWIAANERGAELLVRLLTDKAREPGGEWVDVETREV
jgi:hypothetical protein